MCHGEFGEGVILEQGRASFPVLANSSRSIGAFWPFTSTLFDYINRAMPLFAPQSLKPDEVYSITAFLLNLNEIIEEDFVLTEKNLAKIRLPNEKNFFPKEGNYLKDPRDDDKFKNTKCMSNCIEGEVKVFERIKGISGDYD
jgi:cytochrome c